MIKPFLRRLFEEPGLIEGMQNAVERWLEEHMYKSPIEIIYGKIKTNLEDEVLSAIQRYEILVDKEELIKALNYDRGQYEKGYNDCANRYESDCTDCVYEIREEWEMPCKECIRNCRDYWIRREVEE